MSSDQSHVTCEACGGTTEHDQVTMTLWAPSGLVVIEGVPAHVCQVCGEQYYDDPTQAKLRDLASGGFGSKHVVREMKVPVYSLAETNENHPDEGEKERRSA